MKHEITINRDGRWVDAYCTCGLKGITGLLSGGEEQFIRQHLVDVATMKELATYIAETNKWPLDVAEDETLSFTTGEPTCPTIIAAFTMGGGFGSNYGPAVGFGEASGGYHFYSARFTSKPSGIAGRLRAYVRQQAALEERDSAWRDGRAPVRELASIASSAVRGEMHPRDAETFVALGGRLIVRAMEDGLASIEGTLRMEEVVAMLTGLSRTGEPRPA